MATQAGKLSFRVEVSKGIAGGFCSQSSNAGPSWASGKPPLDPADARRPGIAFRKVRSNSLPSPPPDGSLPLSMRYDPGYARKLLL